ncbi:universal stress protein [Aurantimonas sp. A2-1-M11]|uniref:universal stress protein n=1 Tax=Aurantimonas sp. A2-1-M11 TaxID=3113712 RepID=UPI002F925481
MNATSGTKEAGSPPGEARLADLAVLVFGTERDAATIAYAERVAEGFHAHLGILFANHIVMPPRSAEAGVASLAAEIARHGRASGDATERSLREELGRLAVATELRRADGSLQELTQAVVQLAGTTDLFAVSQPDAHNFGEDELLETILFTAGSAAILIPAEPARPVRAPESILVGWRDTPECSHAVAAALPLLKRASQVFLVSVAEEGSEEQGREPMADMARHLARHGVLVETREIPAWQDVAEGLLHEADVVESDLVVVGAYGHSRLRQLLLGGVTRTLLRKSRVPVLMAH